MTEFIFWLSVSMISYIYVGYYLILHILLKFVPSGEKAGLNTEYFSQVSIIVAAYNEEMVIKRRIKNLLELNYPKDKVEIIIASDGSTDKTADIAKQYQDKGVIVLDFKTNRGRAAVHNDSAKVAKGNIIVFTDATTNFDKNFLQEVVKFFIEEKVGCVVGKLQYKTKESSISKSEGLYWRFEIVLREIESKLDLLATGSGACIAVRKNLFKHLSPIDDVDFTTPLDVILQGHKIVFAKDAVAYDTPPHSVGGELEARIRMTSKNFIGTLRRWGLKGWIRYPLVSWSLLSHKILRWLTPFFMVSVLITNVFLLNERWVYRLTFAGQIAFYSVALVGFIGELSGKRIPLASTIFSFCVGNLGMGIGVIKGLLGKAPASYKMLE